MPTRPSMTPRPLRSSFYLAAGILSSLTAVSHLQAEVRLPAIFGDHMVLQREMNTPVWGWAAPGETVTVTAGHEHKTATAGADGKWSVKLASLTASEKPIEIVIAGKNTITLHDVLVGDVWVCSGQSNMELGSGAIVPREEIAKAENPQIRFFNVPKWVAPQPESDIAPAPDAAPMLGKWEVCTPETVAKNGEWFGFSAVAYLFGRDLHDFTHQPVGLIETCWGGTRIHSWISLETLSTMKEKVSASRGAATFRDHYDEIKHTYETVTLPQYQATLAQWKQDNKAALDAFAEEQKKWGQLAHEAAAQKQPAPPKPRPPKPPREPVDPIHNNQTSCALYNGMIAPLIPFGIKGAIWYQGEANSLEPIPYRAEVPALINDWRKHWGQGDFAFLLVQLPNFQARKPDPSESSWAMTREAQGRALALPNTGLAITIDVGEAGNIHPPDKFDVSQRLALAARHVAYGQQADTGMSPIYKSCKIEGNKVRITFDHAAGGLTIGAAPEHYWIGEKHVPVPAASELQGFAIAGADHKFVWATASIEGDTVVVKSDAVPNPVAVRYAWADNPACNLYSKEGLPVSPFRTDDFPLGK
jgi:sialate O-acetylesterase